MALPKVGSVILKKHHRTKTYDLLFIFLGSRNGTCFLLNRLGDVVTVPSSVVDHMFKTREYKLLDES